MEVWAQAFGSSFPLALHYEGHSSPVGKSYAYGKLPRRSKDRRPHQMLYLRIGRVRAHSELERAHRRLGGAGTLEGANVYLLYDAIAHECGKSCSISGDTRCDRGISIIGSDGRIGRDGSDYCTSAFHPLRQTHTSARSLQQPPVPELESVSPLTPSEGRASLHADAWCRIARRCG